MTPRALVAQFGGPSPVINASLHGVLDACRDYPDQIGELYAGWHGIEGFLQEQLLDLSRQAPEELRLLRTTPAAGAIGKVANSFRQMPQHWITPDGLDVTDEFIRYAKPLIGDGWPEIPVEGGLQRFARLAPTFVPSRLAEYVPQGWR